jgi:phosphoribosyl 1,2-cyclic phosphodiesterase
MSIYVRALASGSSGNALLVRAGDVALLIDAGLPGRRLAALLRGHNVRPGGLAGIMVSHEHADHICGAAALARLYRAPIVANHATLAQLQASPHVATSALPTGATRCFGRLEVSTFAVPHDARDPGSYPWPLKHRILGNGGHLSNDQAGRLLERAFVRAPRHRRWVWLAHLSAENNTPRKAHEQIALRLDLAGLLPQADLSVARRDVPSAEWHSSQLARQLALF